MTFCYELTATIKKYNLCLGEGQFELEKRMENITNFYGSFSSCYIPKFSINNTLFISGSHV